jgi:asparagine synthetase B (glutamine-hydrolysing)
LRQLAAEHGLELRMPYRDRRLVEMMLGLPADLLYRPVVSKWLQREAMRGLLPEVARRRQRPANLYLWAERGLLTIHRRELFARLAATEPAWGRFVAPDWLLPRLEAPSPEARTVHVAWRCLSFGSWLELAGNGRISSDHRTLGRGVRA